MGTIHIIHIIATARKFNIIIVLLLLLVLTAPWTQSPLDREDLLSMTDKIDIVERPQRILCCVMLAWAEPRRSLSTQIIIMAPVWNYLVLISYGDFSGDPVGVSGCVQFNEDQFALRLERNKYDLHSSTGQTSRNASSGKETTDDTGLLF